MDNKTAFKLLIYCCGSYGKEIIISPTQNDNFYAIGTQRKLDKGVSNATETR